MINVGDKVKFRPLQDVKCYGMDEVNIVEIGEVVMVNHKHRWFSVKYGQHNLRTSFLFDDIGTKVFKV